VVPPPGNAVTTDRLSRLLADMTGAGSAVLVMSPHLDDAVLSCGALLAHLAARHPITVATVFTAAAPPPVVAARPQATAGARRIDAEDFFAQRRARQRRAGRIGAAAVASGLPGRLVRRGRRDRPTRPPLRCRPRPGGVLRRHTGRRGERPGGRAHPGRPGAGSLGVGRHVDHLDHPPGRRELGRPIRTVYYSDFPYSQTARPEPDFIARAAWSRIPGWPGGPKREPDRRIPDSVRRIVP